MACFHVKHNRPRTGVGVDYVALPAVVDYEALAIVVYVMSSVY